MDEGASVARSAALAPGIRINRLFSLGGVGSLAPRTRLTTQRPLVQRVAPIIRTHLIHAYTSNSRIPSARTDILMGRRNQG